ncbi:hypothetical protein UR09_01755 [Candidatus Nitromaritima sp. SCGC AAA799-A02]|nr:hypothetical protein UR09_01755 [Candidatus Nitromaritima sp. SCGC AAA799-A02]
MGKKEKSAQKKSGTRLWTSQIDNRPVKVDFSPYKRLTAIGFSNGGVQFIDDQGNTSWEANAGSAILNLNIQEAKKRVVVLTEKGRLIAYDFSGRENFNRDVGSEWMSFEEVKGDFYLWGWNAGVMKLRSSGKPEASVDIPSPIVGLKPVPKKNQFFVIHDSITVALYDEEGNSIWQTNHPDPIEVTGKTLSDIESDDSGENVAICCFNKGVYIYNLAKFTLNNIDLEKMVSHVAISGNGRWFLVADAIRQLYLIDQEGQVVWSETVHDNPMFCRLDKRGEQALVLEKGGLLSCYELHSGDEERSEFLEMADYRNVEEKREIWKISTPNRDRPLSGMLKTSADGNGILFGENKWFTAYDSQGNKIWNVNSLSHITGAYVSNRGDHVILHNDREIFFHDTASREVKHATYYEHGIKEIAVDPAESVVLVFDKKQCLTLFEPDGKEIWKRTINKNIEKLRVCHSGSWAVFTESDNKLYCLGLKSLEADSVVLDEPAVQVSLSKHLVFIGSIKGTCFAMDREGAIRWRHRFKEGIQDIVPLKAQVAVMDKKGRVRVFDEQGELTGEGQTRHSRSRLNCSGDDILEIVPEKKMVACYKLFNDELTWKMPVPSAQRQMDVPPEANRIVIRDKNHLYYYYISGKPELHDERTSYLEF